MSPKAEPSETADVPAGYAFTGRIAAGDERAFAQFYQAWFLSTLALARAISRRDESYCLDVVQDVMMAVANKMPALASDAALRAWMTRAVAHKIRDRSRSEARRLRREQDAAIAESAATKEPWSQLCEQERLAWLVESVAGMPAMDRILLQARFGEAANVAEAAGVLGISSDAAHGRLRRALIRLRQKAAELFHGA